jgi:hypothetical protein
LAHPGSYQAAGQPALADAVAAATALAAANPTQDQVLAGSIALVQAIGAVLPIGDKTALQSLVAVVDQLDAERYTPASWEPVAQARSAAAGVLGIVDASAFEVQDAFDTLAGAVGTLALRAAKAGLASAISVAEAIIANAAAYYPTSLAGLPGALAGAGEVWADANATAAQVTAAQTALLTQISAARLRPASPSAAAAAAPLVPLIALASLAVDPVTVLAEAAALPADTALAASEPAPALKAFARKGGVKIKGKAAIGRKLTVRAGTWSPRPALSYQWYRGTKPIKGATAGTYKVAKADLGKRLSVKVTANRTGFAAKVAASAKTKKVTKR